MVENKRKIERWTHDAQCGINFDYHQAHKWSCCRHFQLPPALLAHILQFFDCVPSENFKIKTENDICATRGLITAIDVIKKHIELSFRRVFVVQFNENMWDKTIWKMILLQWRNHIFSLRYIGKVRYYFRDYKLHRSWIVKHQQRHI